MEKNNKWLILILIIGTFSILNAELGVIGILPDIAEHFNISISKAGLLVSSFALVVAISGVTMPLLLSGINQKLIMLLALGVFVLGNLTAAFAPNFTIALIARVIPALLHPVYISLALTVAAASVRKEDAPKAVSKVFIGISAAGVIGLPTISYIASVSSIQSAYLFCALINALALIATWFFVPSMPVKEKLTYGSQLSVLKKPITWVSIFAVIFLNGAVIGVYSYLAEYLKTVTNMPASHVSLVLVVYGVGGLIGATLAGKMLASYAKTFILFVPIALASLYITLYFLGQFSLAMAFIGLAWGILAGAMGNINQYLIATAAPEAPTFANGLFITSANLGTTVGSPIAGMFISGLGTEYVVFAGVLALLLGLTTIFVRNTLENGARRMFAVKKLSKDL